MSTVVVVNTTSATVEGHFGDVVFHLGPGERLGPVAGHPDDAEGHASYTVWRSEAKSCGSGGSDGMLPGRRVTVTVYEGGTCTVGGRQVPAPGLSFEQG